MPELTTVPMFVFYQGKPGEIDWEKPIEVQYYNGSINLVQQGDYDVPENVCIHPDHLKALLKEIIKHKPNAEAWLKK